MALIAQNTFTVHRKPDDGQTPVIYSLDISDKLVSKSNAGVLTPSSVSARAVLQVGDKREVIGVDEKIDYKGRNLKLNSKHKPTNQNTGSSAYTSNGTYIVTDSTGWTRYADNANYVNGESYTFSIRCRRISGTGSMQVYFCANNGYYVIPASGTLGNQWTVLAYTRRISNYNASLDNALYMYYPSGSIEVDWIKIEKSATATPYAAAPEDAQIKLFTGNGQTETAYTSGSNYAIQSADKLLKWQLLLNDQLQASESTTIVADGDKGDQGDQGAAGAMLRQRGEWMPNTRYEINSQFHDTCIYNGNIKLAKTAHTSGATFDTAKWMDFNEFINLATQVLLANKGLIEVLGAGKVFIGELRDGDGWEMTAGRIKHTKTGLELTAAGKLIAPPGGITFSSGKTVEETIKEQVDAIEVGGRNLLTNSKEFIMPSFDSADDNYIYFERSSCYLEAGVQYVLTGECPHSLEWSSSHGVIGSRNALMWLSGNDGNHYIISTGSTAMGSFFSVPISQAYIVRLNVYKSGQYTFRNIKIEKGNKPTDWSPAPEDVQADIDNITIGGRNYLRNTSLKRIARIGGTDISFVNPSIAGKDICISLWIDADKDGWLEFYPYVNGGYVWDEGLPFIEYKQGVQKIVYKTTMKRTWTGLQLVHAFGIGEKVTWGQKVEIGNKATDWTPAPEDMDYLTEAMQSDTHINGGVVMSNVIAVRNGNDNTEESIVAGMSGLKDDGIFFFADVKSAYRKAVNYFKGISSDKPLFAVSKSGFIIAMTGLIGCFRIARDLVTIQDSTGNDKVKFTGESIEAFSNSVPTMSGGALGELLTDYANSVGSFRQYTGVVETLSYSFNLAENTVFSINVKQNLKLEAAATATESPRVDAESYLRVDYRIEIKNNGVVVLDQLIATDSLSAVTFDGPTRVNDYKSVALNYTQSHVFNKGTVSAKVYARYDMQLYSYSNESNNIHSSAYAKIELVTGSANGQFTFISTTDETIIGSDGLSIRLNSENQFKLLKKDGILSVILKGLITPESNIPSLVCGGDVDWDGMPVFKIGESSSSYRISTGYYRIKLPDGMKGNHKYIVQLTGIETQGNVITMHTRDTNYPCFYVRTYRGTTLSDARFSYMVYRAN